MHWRELTEIGQLNEVDRVSSQSPGGVLIFKHSTRCALSKMVWDRFKRQWNISETDLPVFYLDLIRYRDVSAAVAQRYDVRHESHQVIHIKEGRCVYHSSHIAISSAYLDKVLND